MNSINSANKESSQDQTSALNLVIEKPIAEREVTNATDVTQTDQVETLQNSKTRAQEKYDQEVKVVNSK